jgi:acetyl esterase/lipase
MASCSSMTTPKRSALSFLVLVFLALVSLRAQDAPKFTRTEDVIYGRKFGTALTLDVFEPEKKNGAAVFWIVSGGFFSDKIHISPPSYAMFLQRGYTVFAVLHGSQPRYVVAEIQEDIHRAIRFVRHNAARWGIDAQKFGVTGASAGGHLSLTLGTQGKPGKADAKDPIDRESSAVQAVACWFPPTDFLNWSKPDEDWMDYELMRRFEPAFGPKGLSREERQAVGRKISPIHFVTAAMAPTLVMHGDADKLVPLYQAQSFEQKCRAVGAPFKLVVKAGGEHGWPGIGKDVVVFADWFDYHLRGIKPAAK